MLFSTHQGWRDVESLYVWASQNLPSLVADVSGDDFHNEILTSQEPWLLDFFSPWCGPCIRFAPQFERVAKVDKRINIKKR
jgi:thiol-disulfide isomerase/thioredoxin